MKNHFAYGPSFMFIFAPRYLAVPARSVFDRHSKKYTVSLKNAFWNVSGSVWIFFYVPRCVYCNVRSRTPLLA